jgi:outer membrane immunogenic protein
MFYLGIEGDIDIATLDGTSSAFGIVSATSKNTWMGSIRGRVGFIPVGHAMIYGTVGYGFGSAEFTVSDLTNGLTASVKPTTSGLVWGGGLEVPFSANWTGRIEYLQYDFGTLSTPLENVTISTKDRIDVVRAGLNYRF